MAAVFGKSSGEMTWFAAGLFKQLKSLGVWMGAIRCDKHGLCVIRFVSPQVRCWVNQNHRPELTWVKPIALNLGLEIIATPLVDLEFLRAHFDLEQVGSLSEEQAQTLFALLEPVCGDCLEHWYQAMVGD